MIGSKPAQNCGLRVVALFTVILFVAGCGQKPVDVDKLMSDAKQQQAAGNYRAAIIHFKNLLQNSPDNAEARYLLGMTYNETGEFSSAEKELSRALELRYDPSKVRPALGKALLMQGAFKKVLDQLPVDSNVPSLAQAEILTLRGLATLALGRKQEGRDLIAEALVKQPDLPEALLGQARLAAGEKNLDEAARLIERAIAAAPKNAEAWLMKGDLARMMTDSAGATAAYEKVIELNPDNVSARLNIASLLIASDKFDEARKQIDLARKIAPNSAMAMYMVALIEYRKHNYAAARENVLKVLKVAPNHMPSTLLAGAVEYELGSHAQAQAYLGRIIEAAPDNLYARKLLISSLSKSGHAQRALEVLQPALKQAPGDSALMSLAGDVYMQSNDFAKAGEFFDKAAKVDPKSARARTRLGLSRLASGDTDRALADLESAVQLDSGSYQADTLLVMSYLRRGNFDQAIKAVQTLEKKQPENPLTYNLKAATYLGKKDIANARKSLERALELRPTYVPAAMNLAQLDLQDKDPKSARGRFEAILAKDANNAQALLALANFAPRIGASQEERMGWLERARKAIPTSPQPLMSLTRIYAEAGDSKKALETANQALAISPDNAELLDIVGAMQLAAGQKEQALATYSKLVTQTESAETLYRLAGAQMANANQTAAVASLTKALSLKPDFAEAQVALVELQLREGRIADAMKIAQQAQKQNAKSLVGYALEGDVLMAEKKFPEAVKVYEAAWAIGKSGLLVTKLYGAYLGAGKPDEADARLAQWLKQYPDDTVVRLFTGQVALKRGNYKGAIAQYEWLLKKQPDSLLVLNNLAWAYQQDKDPRAVETAERAYKLKPDSAAVADTLGWMLVEQGNTGRGLDLLQKAVAASPSAQEIRYHLALAWVKSGDKAKARAELERLLFSGSKFPQQAEAMALLKQLRN